MRPISRLLPLATLALLATLGLAACGGAATPAPTTLDLTVKEFTFEPATMSVPAGVPVKLVIKNAGTIEHDIVIDALQVKVLAPVARTTEATIGPFTAGTYQVYCSIPGHKEAGMVGTFEVK